MVTFQDVLLSLIGFMTSWALVTHFHEILSHAILLTTLHLREMN
jgi:hypothetical protein